MNLSPRDLHAFQIPWTQHLLSNLLHRTRTMWRVMGVCESDALRERLDTIRLSRPIYVAGLARSGSTILLEIIAAHADVATHRYRDYWSIFTPVWAERATRGLRGHVAPIERSHGDRIMITPDSPEAMEEMLWMAFFPDLHDPYVTNVLSRETQNARFEHYYRDHLSKMLLVRDKSRYASKANYNITRLGYLLKLFPDARFVLPVRNPRDQIASLMKQHQLLLAAARQYPRSAAYLDRVGHFEFGIHRTPINAGDRKIIEQILMLWREEDEVRGWARYWAHLYGFVADQLEDDPAVREAALVVHYDDLCQHSFEVLSQLCAHCGLDDADDLIARYAPQLHQPDYYQPEFTAEQMETIEQETAEVIERLGVLACQTPSTGFSGSHSQTVR